MSEQETMAASRDLEMGLAQMEQMKGQVEALRSQVASLKSILFDHTNSIEVLRNIEQGEDQEVLMPIGGSAFLKVKVANGTKCLVDRGAGVFVDTPLKEAEELITKRMDSIRNGITSMESTIQDMLMKYDQISKQAQELYSRQMAAGAGPETTF